MVGAWLHDLRYRFTRPRYRRLHGAVIATLVTSLTLAGLMSVLRWRGQQALQADTGAVLRQSAQQLVRSLRSRRGTLTFIRDTLNRQTDLTTPQLRAMGESAVAHTRHLLGAGLIRAGEPPVWWSVPAGLSRMARAQLDRAIVQRSQLRGVWRVPSTLTSTPPDYRRPLLLMLEPLRAERHGRSAVIGVFDLQPLLADFAASSLDQPYPVQLLDGDTLLYRSGGWRPLDGAPRPIVAEQFVEIDAARWQLQMQPGTTRIATTLSWFHVMATGLAVLAGLAVTLIVWVLAARTWILQRIVVRRTAALRRTLQRLRQLATTDDLTGLHNRRFFLERWEREFERSVRYRRPLSCLLVDVNGFKQVNDRLGHQAGDLILKRVADELKAMLRQTDLLARFGGDEFIVALPETSAEQADAVAEKLRQVRIPLPRAVEGRLDPVGLSVGISHLAGPRTSAQAVIQAADESLYRFKRRHRGEAIATPLTHP